MADKLLTIIYSFRDRDTDRIERSLAALNAQTDKNFEVIFVDYGSQSFYTEALLVVINPYPFCRLIRTETTGFPWNKANALNIAIKTASTPFILICDIDIIFPVELIHNLTRFITEKGIVFLTTYFIPQREKHYLDTDRYKNPKYKGTNAACGIHCVSRQVLTAIRGYDEFYSYWGVEDRDIRYRYQMLNLQEIWDESLYQFHQWHPTKNDSTAGYMPVGLWGRNELHFYQNHSRIERNDENWGKIYTKEERISSQFIDLKNRQIIVTENLKIKLYPVYLDTILSIGRFLEDFYALKSGQALAIKNYFFPKPNWFVNWIKNRINPLLNKRHFCTGIDYQQNYLHAFITQFIQSERELIADYYLGYPDLKQNGVTVIVKK